MAKTVSQAFAEFIVNPIRLDSGDNDRAKIGRDNLITQMSKFPDDGKFPALHPRMPNIDFGSFARKTKHRPLDDIDTMIVLNAQGVHHWEGTDNVVLTNDSNASQFVNLCNPSTITLNSIKFVNLFKEYLGRVHHYRNADIHRDGEAVRLELDSYAWKFDVVPSFITNPFADGRTYFIIPDGNGNWKFTDPRIDKERVQRVNRLHVINVLDMVRMAKYWNNRPTMPSMGSYLMENLILDYFEYTPPALVMQTYPYCMGDLLDHISSKVFQPVLDPKGIQGNLNNLAVADRMKISMRAKADRAKMNNAVYYEGNGNHQLAIGLWREIFGSNFPTYS
jgi:hypothetical protein